MRFHPKHSPRGGHCKAIDDINPNANQWSSFLRLRAYGGNESGWRGDGGSIPVLPWGEELIGRLGNISPLARV